MQTVKEKTIKQTDVMNSKFIAILLPLNDDALFKDILKDLKAEYKKAKHYCYAYRVGMKSKSNDDGEPSGTAGRPLLDLLHKRELNTPCCHRRLSFGKISGDGLQVHQPPWFRILQLSWHRRHGGCLSCQAEKPWSLCSC